MFTPIEKCLLVGLTIVAATLVVLTLAEVLLR